MTGYSLGLGLSADKTTLQRVADLHREPITFLGKVVVPLT